MGHSISLRHAEQVLRIRSRDDGRVSSHRVCLGVVSCDKQFKLAHHYKISRVSDYRSKEFTIALVAAQLAVSVAGTRDIDGLQTTMLAGNLHNRREPQLPVRVKKRRRHHEVETDAYVSKSLGNMIEPCHDLRCGNNVRCDHLAGFVIPYRVHYQRLSRFPFRLP